MKRSNRMANLELLRIIAMLMIITMHYLDKGGFLPSFSEVKGTPDLLIWLLEALCVGAVNVYVLISGYFLVDSEFKVKKIVMLWLQILFYSWIIGAIFIFGGFIPAEEKTFYDLIFIAFPVTSGHYWFPTVYLMLYALSPFLNRMITAMDEKTHRRAILVLVLIFSIWNSFLPFTIPMTDHEGMDLPWFVCLYVMAAYLKRYGIPKWNKKMLLFAGYLLCAVLTVAAGLVLNFAQEKTGKLGGYATNFFAYNSILTLFGSVCLVLFFLKIRIQSKVMSRIICVLASGSFGVYLLHEHRYIRYRWLTWLGADRVTSFAGMLLMWVLSLVIVYLIGFIIEKGRQFFFSLPERIKKRNDSGN